MVIVENRVLWGPNHNSVFMSVNVVETDGCVKQKNQSPD